MKGMIHMAREHPSNIQVFCGKHRSAAPKPIATDRPLSSFVGKFVKRAFAVIGPDGCPATEHMWVRVDRVAGTHLLGVLDNDPVFKAVFKAGDRVTVGRHEIEGVLE